MKPLIKYLLFLLPFTFLYALPVNKYSIDYQVSNYSRVRVAHEFAAPVIKKLFNAKGLNVKKNKVFFRAYKYEKVLELWAFDKEKDQYVLLKSYPICALSGDWGPKRQQGDRQVPEGFYRISHFNPKSKFYLSMQINYPNESDKIRTTNPKDPGNYIMIHGKCASIGCISIQDNPIEELYWLCLQRHNAGQRTIPVHIYPCRLDAFRYKLKKYLDKDNTEMIAFWEELEAVHQYFDKHRKLPKIKVGKNGAYSIR